MTTREREIHPLFLAPWMGQFFAGYYTAWVQIRNIAETSGNDEHYADRVDKWLGSYTHHDE